MFIELLLSLLSLLEIVQNQLPQALKAVIFLEPANLGWILGKNGQLASHILLVYDGSQELSVDCARPVHNCTAQFVK